jgi:outer membrane protein assembly factor BamB
VTIEEERLSEMLHRLTPEPPRAITVEDIAIRLANQAAPARHQDHTTVLHLGKRGRMRWAPALAAASVVVVVGASAGIGVALTSHSGNKPNPPANGGAVSSATGAASPSDTATTPVSTHPPEPRIAVANGMWGAVLIDRDSYSSGTLAGGAGSLYAVTDGALVRIDPSSGNILQQVSVQTTARPVVVANTVWVAEPDANGVTLRGYDAHTLSPRRTISVSGGAGAWTPEGILAAGPSGDLYVVTGNAIVAVDSSNGSVKWRTPVSGQAGSVAVTPDGGGLYAAINDNGSFRLVAYDPATGRQLSSTAAAGRADGGYLVATSGGVWGSFGFAMSQRVWFAPGGDMSKIRQVTGPASGSLDAVPTFANGVVWVGGTRTLQCLDPSSGQVLGSTSIPANTGVPEHFGSVAYTSGHAFALFTDQRAQLEGVAAVTPPSACAG